MGWPDTSGVDGTPNSTTDTAAPDIDAEKGDPGFSAFLHDLNNQLGIIINYSELLLGSPLPSSARVDVQEINGAAQRAAARAATYSSTILHDPPDPAARPL